MALHTVAFMHYHLRGGGVTRIIEHAQAALCSCNIQSIVFVGEAPVAGSAGKINNICVVDGLGYSEKKNPAPFCLSRQLTLLAEKKIGSAPQLWHIHNHSLGKNTVIPALVQELAANGEKLLLQIHDFAEDGRPANYSFLQNILPAKNCGELEHLLYPQGNHIHYALINQRDQRFLQAAGARAECLHYLPNAAHLEFSSGEEAKPICDGNLYLYPTRGIRRKNIGEFLLWSCLAEEGDIFALTLAPQNPAARLIYDNWRNFAKKLDLPVRFALGKEYDFGRLLASAKALYTTSVGEGFGLAFLETSLLSKQLYGRAIPEITNEFTAASINLSALYQRVDLPVSWVGIDVLRKKIATKLSESMAVYNVKMTENDLELALNSALKQGKIDFGRLDEEMQMLIIERVRKNIQEFKELNPVSANSKKITRQELEHNRKIVSEKYSLQKYSDRLLEVYEAVINSEAEAAKGLESGKLLQQFLDPSRFFLLKTLTR